MKTISISPKNPFVFKAELDRAMGRTTGLADVEVLPQVYPSAHNSELLHLEEKHSG